MNNPSDTTQIISFLIAAKNLVELGCFCFVPRNKNMNSLAMIGWTISDAKDEILSLSVNDYYGGPKRDLDLSKPGDIWEFKKTVENKDFYVKLKIDSVNGNIVLKCISFHEDEF